MLTKLFYCLIYFVFFLLTCAEGFGQIDVARPFEFARVSAYPNPQWAVEFIDSATNKVFKQVNFKDLDPFTALILEKDILSTSSNSAEVIYLLDTSRALTRLDTFDLLSATYTRPNTTKLKPVYLKTTMRWGGLSQNYCVVNIFYNTLNINKKVIATHVLFYVFNREGTVVARSPVFNLAGGSECITSDGRYILIKNWGPIDDYAIGFGRPEEQMKTHICIYDCEAQKIIVSKDLGKYYSSSVEVVAGRIFGIGGGYQGNSYSCYIDIYNNILYSKSFLGKEDDLYLSYGTGAEGIYYKKPTGEIILKYAFNKDFQKTKLIEK